VVAVTESLFVNTYPMYSKVDPLYPFGYGLSYTSFQYSNLRLSASSVDSGSTVQVSVDLTNTGGRAGDEVVQLYTHQRTSRDKEPLKQLRTFQRVNLLSGQTKTVRLTLAAKDLAHWDVNPQPMGGRVFGLRPDGVIVRRRRPGAQHPYGAWGDDPSQGPDQADSGGEL
jgi:hypothetical protein